jgi:hypothetical protein
MPRKRRVIVTMKPDSMYYAVSIEVEGKSKGSWEAVRPAKLIHKRRIEANRLGYMIASMLVLSAKEK